MYNGLANFKCLGRRWCTCLLAFAPLICLSDWTTNDADNLGACASHLSSIQTGVDRANGNLEDIVADIEAMQYYDGTLHHLSVVDFNLYGYIQALQSALVSSLSGINTSLNNFRSDFSSYRGDFNSFRTAFGTYSSTVTSSLDDISDTLDDLSTDVAGYIDDEESRFNRQFALMSSALGNVTNSLSSISSAIANLDLTVNPGGVLNTNLFATLLPYYDPSNYWIIDNLFYYLYGRYPSSLEIAFLDDIYYMTSSQRFVQSYLPFVDLYAYIQDTGINLDIFDSVRVDDYFGISELGSATYYEYGTRPLIQFFEQATNDYPISSAVITGSGSESSFSAGFVDTVESLSASFTEVVDTNVTQITDSPITQIADGDYGTSLSEIKEENLLDTTDIDGLSDAVASINQQFLSALPDFQSQDSFVIDFGTISIFQTNRNVSFTLTRPPAVYWNVQAFVFGVIKAIALYMAVHAIYMRVIADTSV